MTFELLVWVESPVSIFSHVWGGKLSDVYGFVPDFARVDEKDSFSAGFPGCFS